MKTTELPPALKLYFVSAESSTTPVVAEEVVIPVLGTFISFPVPSTVIVAIVVPVDCVPLTETIDLLSAKSYACLTELGVAAVVVDVEFVEFVNLVIP